MAVKRMYVISTVKWLIHQSASLYNGGLKRNEMVSLTMTIFEVMCFTHEDTGICAPFLGKLCDSALKDMISFPMLPLRWCSLQETFPELAAKHRSDV